MNLLLKQYIKNYLLEAASTAIAMPASSIGGEFQHNLGASYQNDMTSLNDEESLLKVLENVGNNCFISFVDKYDENIPRLEINPDVSYDTPHGNYAYPLTIKSLKDIIEKSRIGGTSFALNRPYFHMFKKSNNVNAINLEKDGSNNYSGDFRKDLKTIVHTSIIFKAAKFLESNEFVDMSDLTANYKSQAIFFAKNRIGRKIKANSNNNINDNRAFNKTLLDLLAQLCRLYQLNNNQFPINETKIIVDFISKQIYDRANSKNNIFFNKKTNKALSDFHILYYGCWLLSTLLTEESYSDFPSDNDNRIMGPVFTMLLNSIDIDFINDKGSQTIHKNEPIQAVYLNSSKEENIVLIGTFNNIFSTKKINSIDDLFNAYHESSSNSNKGVTMNKVVDMIEKNPQLGDLFGTELFDDVKLENSLEYLREKAWQDLTKKQLKIAKFKQFHLANKIIRLNIYQQSQNTSNPGLIIFDIGIKKSFKNADINQQLLMIHEDLPKIVQIEDSLTYLQVFLSKYQKKNVYHIFGMNALSNMTETLDKIQDYAASIEIESEEVKKQVMSLQMFIYIVQDIINLAYIAHESTLHDS
jgi:hypothetical protein